jgi:outer membrane receptor protein involved in Fe transport
MRRRLDSSKLFCRSLIATAVATALAGPTITWAQTVDATLRGRAPANSAITAKNVATGVTRHTTAGADGSYTLLGLPPGTYRVDAGPGTEIAVTLSVATDVTLDLAARGAEIAPQGTLEEVTVKARRLVEVKTSEVGDIVSLYDIANVPQITRNFLEFADLVPGMAFTVDSNGNTSLRGGAQLDTSVNVFIDGVSQKDYVSAGGGTIGQTGAQNNGDPGNPFPQLAIEQYKVITSNYKAEFGEAASAVVVAQTKSGTNEFHGEMFGTFTNQNLRAETPAEIASATVTNPKSPSPSDEYGFAVGGPIIQDALHFFVTWEHKSLSLQNVVFPGGGASAATAQAVLPTSVFAQFGPVTNPFKEDLAFGKIDFEPTSADRFELSGKLRRETQVSGASGQTAASASSQYKNNDIRGDLYWQHSADRWVNDARLTYQNAESTTDSSNPNPQIQYIYFPNSPALTANAGLITVGGPGSGLFRNAQSGAGLQDDFTLSELQWLGDHTVKLGGRYQGINLTTQNASNNLHDATYYYSVTPAGVAATPYEVQFPETVAGVGSPKVTSKDKQFGVYFQDDWKLNQHLTFNLGVRWDYEKVPAWENYVTPAAVVAALNGPFTNPNYNVPTTPAGLTYAQVLALGGPNYPGININNYISTGKNRKAPTDQFQPRIGLSWDINEDQNYVIFGGYGRAYDRNLFSTLGLETTKIALNNNPQVYFPDIPAGALDSFAPAGCLTAANINPTNHCYAWNPAYLNPANLASFVTSPTSHEVDMLNNRLKSPYSDQFSIGFRSRLGDWNTTVTLADIKSYNTILGHWGGRYANGQIYQGGQQWGAQGVPGIGSLILWDNGGRDKDLQLGIAASKPYTVESGWSTTIAYTFSDAYQTNSSGNPADYNVNYNQYLFDYPYPNLYPFVPSNAIPKHRLVATYSHDAPWGLVFAAKLTLETPIPVGGAAGCPNGQATCTPYGGSTLEVSGKPRDFLGYRDVDVQVTKNIKLPLGMSAYVRLDILNALNIHNFDSSAAVWNQSSKPPVYDTAGPIIGVPFTVKLTAGYKF